MNRFTPIANAATRPRRRRSARRYWAFLSYAHEDSKAATRLHNWLERYRVPKELVGSPHPLGTIPKRLTPVFRDRQELAASNNLGREIQEALKASSCFIVLCSPQAAQSRWVDEEIRDFKRLHGEDRVFAAILDGEPFSGDPATECFPPALRQRIAPDGRDTGEPAEPIAADLRVEGDGWRGGLLKIVAGMLDVGLDDLVQRDQQRRQRRMVWMAAASLAGMTVTSGLALFALDQRNAAREERREAEGLVEFMLGDLRNKLEPIGKLEALDGVGGRILAYYSKQDASELDDAGLLQRSKALTLTAQVAFARQDFNSAERLYREALAGTGEAVERNPGDPQRLFDHAQNVFYISELARLRGRLNEAEAATREYQRLADRMVAIEPTNLKWRLETVYAAENMAIVLLNKRQFAETSRRMEAVLGPMLAIARAYPDNNEYQRELSNVLAWLADARRDGGQLAEAKAARERQIAILTDHLSRGGDNVQFQDPLLTARRALGNLLADTGQLEQSARQFRLAIVEATKLIQIEPENGIWKGNSALARLELARVLIDLDRITQAKGIAEEGCGLIAEMRLRAPNASDWHEAQTNCELVRARLSLADGSLNEALTHAGRALESARSEPNADPLRTRYRIATTYRLIGDIRRRTGDGKAAREAWVAGFAQLPSNVPERPREMNERMQLLERLGRTAESRAVAARLEKMKFRSLT
ncbi:TIR domain-containing protein [Sphingomonas sp. HDW15A]|uniref:TIR domain-containing protein n=1 Tax=Sphingomonas sp. HDW15A TaxID=2714942 RepID=UPI001408AB61|nr:TIR domain-containing protein [Sphingomonas sp. HDW15A]QIK97044.1 TIR domain-containing protein [Sphingomonas sp. HDW15A]